MPGQGSDVVFAVKTYYLGGIDRDGTSDKKNGWKQYGYDIDGVDTNCVGTACGSVQTQCKRVAGADPSVIEDGTNGTDNSFGHNILRLFESFQVETAVNSDIANGKSTLLIDIQKLGSGVEYNPLLAKLYNGADLGGPPKFDGSDIWPVTPESLSNSQDITSAKLQFPNSYVVGNTWVSGSRGTIDGIVLSVTGNPLTLNINAAVLSFQLSSDHTTGTNGILSGVLDLKKFEAVFGAFVGGATQGALCPGTPLYDQIVLDIGRAADIMHDGSAGTPNETCDGISIGLGFDVEVVQLGGIAPPASPHTDPCSSGGAGNGAGGLRLEALCKRELPAPVGRCASWPWTGRSRRA